MILYADPTGPSVQQLIAGMKPGDEIQCNPGEYTGTAQCTRAIDLKITPRDGRGTVLFNGNKQWDRALDFQSSGKFTCWDIDFENYRSNSVRYNSGGTGKAGTPGYNPALVMNPRSTYDIRRCRSSETGGSDPTAPGFSNAQWGFWCNGGYRPVLEDLIADHCGDTNESIGVVSYFAYQPTIRRIESFGHRKEGIRYGYCFQPVVDSSLTHDCWSGITSEYVVGGCATNNISYDNDWDIYVKQTNNNANSNPFVRQFWGDALGLGGQPVPPELHGIWHNTFAAGRFICLGLATQYFMDFVDVRNNLLVGIAYLDVNGVPVNVGDAFVQDVGGASLMGPNVMLDYNTYVVADGQPPYFLTKGQSTPGGTASAKTLQDLQAWRGLGWEQHGQVADPKFKDAPGKDFTPIAPLKGYDLTANPLNPTGSPYGTQVGADPSLVPAASYKGTYRIPTLDSSSGTLTSIAKALDLRYLTYGQWPTRTGSTGQGIDEWMIVDFGVGGESFNHLITGNTLVNNSQLKTVRFEVSNDKSKWTNLAASPGFVKWPQTTDTLRVADTGQTSHVFELGALVTTRYLKVTVVDTWGADNATIGVLAVVDLEPSLVTPPPPPPPDPTPVPPDPAPTSAPSPEVAALDQITVLLDQVSAAVADLRTLLS